MNKRRLTSLASFIVAIVGLGAGCQLPDVVPPPPGQMLRADVPHVDAEISSDDFDLQVRGNQDLAFELYHLLTAAQDDDDLIFSPHSIETALAMTYAGSRGDTAAGMREALNVAVDDETLHASFNRIDAELAARYAEAKNGERPFRLRNVNQVFAQKDVAYEDAYLETLARHYDAGVSLYDFPEDHAVATAEINDWVSRATEGKIEDLLPAGAIDRLTRLVLVNAIYFNAAWASSFEEDNTRDEAFTLESGDEISVPTMHQDLTTRFARDDRFDAVELDYDGGEIAMLIIAPHGDFNTLETELDAELLAEVEAALGEREIALALPRFKIEGERTSLKDALAGLGMDAAFDDERADFSGISEELAAEEDLHISDVIHKAFIDVDESGTEAAAATAVVMAGTTSISEPLRIDINRPFIFAIRDKPTGQLLFLGRVLDPR